MKAAGSTSPLVLPFQLTFIAEAFADACKSLRRRLAMAVPCSGSPPPAELAGAAVGAFWLKAIDSA